MKTAILTAALMILMTAANARTFTLTTKSTDTPESNFKVWVLQPGSDVIKFRVTNPAEEKIVLKIYNDKKEKVFHRTIKNEKATSILCDMSKCADGTYTCVVLRNGQEELRKPVTLK
jgi:hypothetical protein